LVESFDDLVETFPPFNFCGVKNSGFSSPTRSGTQLEHITSAEMKTSGIAGAVLLVVAVLLLTARL